jgi:S1-C subfamily serine protease
LAAALAVALAGCGNGGGSAESHSRSGGAAADSKVVASAPVAGGADIPALVKRLAPSVVAVLVQTSNGGAEGSGVVWDDQGHIVTNNHVVEDAQAVVVQTARGRRMRADVVATDPRTDLAVIEVSKADLPAAGFADHLPQVGSLALALGSPLGFENTVTAGIISGFDREIPSGGAQPSLVGLLQTDAAISPGNSGGALVGPDGDVVGINVAYLPPGQTGAVSIGFAIPAPVVRDVVPQLISNGHAEHPYLGVRLAPGAELGRRGAIVVAVQSGGPAADANVRPGDVVVGLDGRDIGSIEDVYAALRPHKPGDQVKVRLERDGRRRTVTVKLGELPEPGPGVLPGH